MLANKISTYQETTGTLLVLGTACGTAVRDGNGVGIIIYS